MGDDIGWGLSSMAVYFDFRSTNVVQLSNRNPYFYKFQSHHPLIIQLNLDSYLFGEKGTSEDSEDQIDLDWSKGSLILMAHLGPIRYHSKPSKFPIS